MAHRVQLSRKLGWKMPENTLKVDRSTTFGNPFKFHDEEGRRRSVELFRRCLTEPPSRVRHLMLTITKGMDGRGEGYFADLRAALPKLRGKNLACWCPLDGSPCHADVLLKLANAPPHPEAPTG